MIEVYRTRERDPQVAAKRIVQPGESILSGRGHNVFGMPSCRIRGADGKVRIAIVSAAYGEPTDD